MVKSWVISADTQQDKYVTTAAKRRRHYPCLACDFDAENKRETKLTCKPPVSDVLDTESVTDKRALLCATEAGRVDSRTFSLLVAGCWHPALSDVLERRAQFTSWERH